MVLIALVPLLTSTLGSLLAETAAGKLAGFGADKGKNVINKLTKKLLNKTLFKKKLSDLPAEDFFNELKQLLPESLNEFVKVANEELKNVLSKVDDIETILKTTIGQVTETVSKIETKNDALLELVKQTLTTKRENLPDLCLDPDWYYELKHEINYANQQNLQFVASMQTQLVDFQKNLELILKKVIGIDKKVTIIDEKTTNILKMLQRKFKNRELTENELLELSKLRIEKYKDFFSKGDIAFAPEKYIERTNDENNPAVKPILDAFIKQNFTNENQPKKRFFLLLGEAGMGKTWLLTKTAIKYIQQDYPVFFITLRDGIKTRLHQIFNVNEPGTVEQRLIDLQNNLSRWLILIFDGFDEIVETADKRTLIHTYLDLLQNQLNNTLIIISSRYFDWFNDEYTEYGSSRYIENTLWNINRARCSFYLEKFSEKELIAAVKKYKLPKQARLNTWNKEIREIALRPVWMRLICEIYSTGDTPSFASSKLYNAYFDRVFLKKQHYDLIGEISELLLERKHKFSAEFSTTTKYFKEYATQIQELHSKNILIESKTQNQRVAKTKFITPRFGHYGLAYQLYSKIHDLEQAREREQISNQNTLKNFSIKLKQLEPNLQNTIFKIASQITEEHGYKYDIPSVLEESKTNIPPQKITITQLVTAIQQVEKIYKSTNLQLFQVAKQLKVSVKELKITLELAILEERIKCAIDDRGTIDENDDIIRLDENWNIIQIIHRNLTEVKLLLQPKDVGNLDKAKKLIQELEAYNLPEKEINTKQQLIQEIAEITIQDKFIRSTDLFNTGTLQNLEQAREILQSLQHSKLHENQQVKLQKLSEKTELKMLLLKFEEISNCLVNPTQDKLNQAELKLSELEDSKLKQEERAKKQNLLLTISNELDKIQAKKVEIMNAKQKIKLLAENGQLVNAKIQEVENKYKEYLTKSDFEFLKKYITEEYYGISLQAKAKLALNQLEQMCGKQIPVVKEINWNTFGYVNTGITITGLGLYEQGLSSLPESISSLKNLRKLHLDNNQLSSLPESIPSLEKLQVLNLDNNQLSSLPESISSLKNLRKLRLGNNQLSSLPESISSLQKLRVLNLWKNRLSSLPESLSSLHNLQGLYLHYNKLSSLPESLALLQELRVLSLWNNQLSSLPESLSSLKNLRELHLDNNQLSSLPESISSLQELQELHLGSNQLSSLPESLGSLKNLQKLNLHDNKLSSLPENVKDALRKLEKNGCQIY